MNFETNHNANDNTSGKYYFEVGRSVALNSKASVFSLSAGLDGAYSEFQKREKNYTRERIAQYEAEIQSIVIEKNKIDGDIQKVVVQKQLKDDDIEYKKTDLQKVRSEGVETNSLPFIIGTLILVLLTLYLFMFYASTGYSAFFGIPSKLIGGFLAPTVFEDAARYGNGALIFIVLFPIVFLALGYMVHTFLDKKKYTLLFGVLTFTLAFDIFMAYQIAMNAHALAYDSGLTSQDWQAGMAFQDVKFYIIIASGFVVYVVWGYLLNNVINQWYSIQPNQAKAAEIEKIREQIIKMTTESAELNNAIVLQKNTLISLDASKAELEKKCNILRSGGIVVDVTALRGMVGEFIGGWCLTINFLMNSQKDLAEKSIMDANDRANVWLDNTLAKLSNN